MAIALLIGFLSTLLIGPPPVGTTTIRPPAQGRARHLDGNVPPDLLTQTPPLKVQHPWDDYPPAHPRELPPSVVAAPLYL